MSHLKQAKITTIALTGGSTGGHVFPLASLYNYLKNEKDYDFVWIGEEGSLEEEIAGKLIIRFLDIPAGKIRRYFDIKNFYEPLKNLTGIFFGIYYIIKYKIDIVFSKGGYVSLPLCIAAFILRKKIFIHESDSISGLANKIIGKVATKIFYTFPNELIDNEKHILSGQILNPELLDKIKNLTVGINTNLSVLVIAGSQGSTKIFETLIRILPDLLDVDFNIILGEKNLHFREEFKYFKNVKIYDFLAQDQIGIIMKKTDIAITRGGATTLWELNMFGIHSIIVPLPGSAGDHQEYNAMYFHEKFGSDVLDENNKFDIELFRKLQKYKVLRKSGLNLDGFFKSLQIIEKEIK
ncbi:MAG: UDP-N-acetylglucosamine--N-acetylmuramyl-(pentapeptide) pyrophosphoryl-undecaprenol N-acetylglucosamine transferase [Candidatus Gracilibacteria bacterium]|nr:UDP-N-acetylglucosamine--N-acetylmuramyl-(pentapeptide) pyrophosphoryl-undecaprenol N-acetylglucosamine transferase [Candidatus Gracilibacteria bacterium]